MTFNKTSKPGFSLPFDSCYTVDLLGQILIPCNFQHAVQTWNFAEKAAIRLGCHQKANNDLLGTDG